MHVLPAGFGRRHAGLGLLDLFGPRAVLQLGQRLAAQFQLRLGRLDFELDRVGEQLGERLALCDAVAFVERKLDHAAVDRAADRRFLRGHHRADERLADGDFPLDDRRDDHQRRPRRPLRQALGRGESRASPSSRQILNRSFDTVPRNAHA